jgi:hypothetical protein
VLGSYTSWTPRRSATEITSDIYAWINEHEQLVSAALIVNR